MSDSVAEEDAGLGTLPLPSSPTNVRGIIAGGLIGALGVAGFGVIHAIAIVPIWNRLAQGLLFAVPSGILLGWSIVELHHTARVPRSRWLSWGYGLLVWVTLLPAIVLANALRLLSVNGAARELADVIEVAITALVAFGIAHAMATGWKAKVSFAIATCVLLLAGGGPIPVVNGPRARDLFIGVSALWLVAGAVLGRVVLR